MYPSPNGGGGSNGRVLVPTSFYREPSRSAPYTRFSPFAIIWDLNELKQLIPPLPALLVPNDVMHEDWNRCISDVTQAWSGIFPYDIWNHHNQHKSNNVAIKGHNRTASSSSNAYRRGQMKTTMRPSSAVARTVDVWNISFFHDRGLELVLYRGLERRTGETAGSRQEKMKMDQVPAQYQSSIMGRRKRRPSATPHSQRGMRNRRGEESESDEDVDSDASSLTSSASSSSSSEEEDEEEDLDEEEDEDEYERNPYGRYKSAGGGAGGTASRRNSMAAGAGVDPYDRWSKKSRVGWKLIEKRQKIQKKRRKLERRQRRQMMREEPLYSMWMSCRSGSM